MPRLKLLHILILITCHWSRSFVLASPPFVIWLIPKSGNFRKWEPVSQLRTAMPSWMTGSSFLLLFGNVLSSAYTQHTRVLPTCQFIGLAWMLPSGTSGNVALYVAPSQPQEPFMPSPQPEWPFQAICMDFIETLHYNYLACVDRYSGCLIVYKITPDTRALKSTCGVIFSTCGAPEELSLDGRTMFTSHFQAFLQDWGVEHHLCSAHYPQFNGRT